MSKKIELTLEEMWELVQRHYNNAGYKHPITKAHLKLNRMPEPLVVRHLFVQMQKLYDAEYEFKRAQEEKRK